MPSKGRLGRWILIREVTMAKDMTAKEKLIFLLSFFWAMHWGVRLTTLIFTTLELRFF